MANPFASRGVFTGYLEQTAGSSFGHTRTSFERGRPLVSNTTVPGGSRPPLPPAHNRNLQLFRHSPQALTASTELDFVRDHHTGPAADLFGSQGVQGRGREQGREGGLPAFLTGLLNPRLAVDLPPPDRMKGVRLNNRELDKLVNNLGRNPATWRRSLLLHTWLQDLGHRPDARLCTSLIKVASSHGQGSTALSIYEWMRAKREEGGAALQGTVHTYTVAMRAGLAANMLPQALKVWDDAIATGCQPDCRMCTALLEICTRSGDTDRALSVYRDMRGAGPNSALAPTVHTYTAAMRAAAEGGAWESALDIWQDMEMAGCRPSAHAYSAAISACAVGGQWEQAVKHFDDMLAADVRPDVVSCTALMTALGRVGQWERAERTIAWMHRAGVRPNVRTYTAYIAALGTAREWGRVATVLKSMRDGRSGVEANSYTYAALLKVMGEQGEWELAESLFLELENQALDHSHPFPSCFSPAAEIPWPPSEHPNAVPGTDLDPALAVNPAPVGASSHHAPAGSLSGLPVRTHSDAFSSQTAMSMGSPSRPRGAHASTSSRTSSPSSRSSSMAPADLADALRSGMDLSHGIPTSELQSAWGCEAGASDSWAGEEASDAFAAVPNALAEEALEQGWQDHGAWLPDDLPGQSNATGMEVPMQQPVQSRSRQHSRAHQSRPQSVKGSGLLDGDAWNVDAQGSSAPKVQLNEVICATMMS
ncbi:hypothetical protein WJX84_000847, partial [Apatococcus fuscideae]